MNNSREEREKRKERLRMFSNSNQWMRKRNLEQTLEEMSAQLREYRRDLQQIRMQEAATEAKIDKLQQQVYAIEESLQIKKQTVTNLDAPTAKIADYYENIDLEREGYVGSYSENGLEREERKSTVILYA